MGGSPVETSTPGGSIPTRPTAEGSNQVPLTEVPISGSALPIPTRMPTVATTSIPTTKETTPLKETPTRKPTQLLVSLLTTTMPS